MYQFKQPTKYVSDIQKLDISWTYRLAHGHINEKHLRALYLLYTYNYPVAGYSLADIPYTMGRNNSYSLCRLLGYEYNDKTGVWEAVID